MDDTSAEEKLPRELDELTTLDVRSAAEEDSSLELEVVTALSLGGEAVKVRRNDGDAPEDGDARSRRCVEVAEDPSESMTELSGNSKDVLFRLGRFDKVVGSLGMELNVGAEPPVWLVAGMKEVKAIVSPSSVAIGLPSGSLKVTPPRTVVEVRGNMGWIESSPFLIEAWPFVGEERSLELVDGPVDERRLEDGDRRAVVVAVVEIEEETDVADELEKGTSLRNLWYPLALASMIQIRPSATYFMLASYDRIGPAATMEKNARSVVTS